jgi:hypothetical protein
MKGFDDLKKKNINELNKEEEKMRTLKSLYSWSLKKKKKKKKTTYFQV